jgi:hypothetical protein
MMKLRLELDELAVQSFHTTWTESKGTVIAYFTQYGFSCENGESCDGACGTFFCGTGATCDEFSCIDSCLATCAPCSPTQQEAASCMLATSCRPPCR